MQPPARQASLRSHNLGLALRLVAGSPGPVSRAQVAAATGLTRATASTLAEALLAGGLLVEGPLPPTERSGRPATGLRLAGASPAGLGLAIDVDHVAACVVDLSGTVRARRVVAGDQRGARAADVVRRVARLAARTAVEAGLPLAGATVAVPGLVDPGGRRLLRAPNLGWQDVGVLDLLAKDPLLAPLRLRMDNEADLATLAEAPYARGDFAYLSGEVGLGAGIVLDGRLHRGGRGWSGEIGHLTVDRRGPRCSCGARGCLEQYAGQEALLRRSGLPVAAAASRPVPEPAVRRLVELAEAGRRPVLRALDDAGHALGVVLAGVVNLLDLDEVVLGGSLALLAGWLVPGIELELARHVLWSSLALPVVRPSRSGANAVVEGAARASTEALLADPAGWLAGRP